MSGDERVAAAFAAYEAATGRVDVARARLALVAALRATGWECPAEVRDQAERDERTVRDAERAVRLPRPDVLRAPSHRPPASIGA